MRGGAHAVLAAGDALGLIALIVTFVHKFFHLFLDALVDMQDEYISLPSDMAALRRVPVTTRRMDCPVVWEAWTLSM